MAETEDFQALIHKLRTGDQEAAKEFVSTYEPAIRRAARIRLLDPRLAPLLDSTDIVQSVFASFFVRAALGQYELNEPEQVLALLVTMSRKKLADFARKQAAARRDYRRTSPWDATSRQLPGAEGDPATLAATAELLKEFRRRLSPEERELAELRSLGQTWSEIAAARGECSDTLRKRLDRAVSRISQDLGIDEGTDE